MGCFFGVIGHPIRHSLSPWIHEHFLNMTKKNGIYRAIDIPGQELSRTLETLKKIGIDGFNITVPHKENVIKYLDELDPLAEKMGAVNTVVCQNGKWIGYNTDGKGYIRSLNSQYPDVFEDKTNKNVLILGAGGAARGIYFALIDEGFARVDVANRTMERARQLQSDQISTQILALQDAQERLDEYDLIIQTTKTGMHPNVDEQVIGITGLKESSIVSDIVYNPIETAFLQNAKRAGARIHYGHGMLLYQAAFAFELWTGIHVDPESLMDPLEDKLKGGF
ncbi:MAG: shikimate dehydrogenase [Bacillaceae bacterium]|nr:shikimate dehydrogenase [Bacillaceae bacterium]